jgi:hypothetical protein
MGILTTAVRTSYHTDVRFIVIVLWFIYMCFLSDEEVSKWVTDGSKTTVFSVCITR